MVKKIAHLADIHIRKLHRFNEYREVFQNLYKKLKHHKPDLIYIGGDVVHGKLDTSPEETRMVADFFLALCDIAPTIIIPGNHDCNLNNKSREDTLSPIIDLVKKINPNIHYWKESGHYTLDDIDGGIDFSVLSIFDIDKEGNQVTDNLPNPNDLDGDVRIALHHGSVGTHQYDNGFEVKDDRVTNETFKGYDLVLLGDIHKRQFLNKEETIAYPGSLIQQGFAEEPAHGFLLWDVEKKSARFVQVENDYGFKVVNVENGVIQNKMNFVPPKGKIKIKYWNTTLEQIKDIQIDLRKQYPEMRDVIAEKQDAFSKIDGESNKIDIGDVRDINYQNELISEYLKNNIEGVDGESIKRVCELNKMTNNSPEIYDGDVTRNVDWKLKSFEFDNMFSYGEGSKIDFTKLNGVAGIVAPNHSGKSAVMDAIAYTIFDVCSRTNRAIDVLNKKKNKFKAKLNLEINGEDYWIERECVRKIVNHKDGRVTQNCPVKVKFYMIDGDSKIDLSGAARFNSQYGSGTNEEIKKILGSFDDFILTSLSLQNNGTDFVDKKQSERKQILSQFMDIDIFEQLESIAKSDSNEERIMLRQFQKKDSYKELGTINQKITELEVQEKKLSDEDDRISTELTILENKNIELVKKLYKVDSTILQIDDLNYEKGKKELDKRNLEKSLIEDREYKETLRPLFNEYNEKLHKFDEDEIKDNYENFKQLSDDVKNTKNKIKLNESKTKTLIGHKNDLEKFEYDENCEYCVKNGEEQINEMDEIKTQLYHLDDEWQKLEGELKLQSYALRKVEDAEDVKEEYDRFSDEISQIRHDAVKIGGKITTQESEIKKLEAEIVNLNIKISQHYENEQKIKENEKLDIQISDLKSKISILQFDYNVNDKKYKEILSNLSVAKSQKQQIEDDIQKLVDIEQKILDYDLYLMALSKDGVPYELISKTIPAIEKEVNQVLDNMMVGFNIKLTMDGKNIETMICYEDNCWNLELSSGMEKFVSSLAIRIGLINISTLPRPNFLVIDEGFGSLDGDNIANMEGAFQYLKTQFDFVLIVSHLDTIKDYMDMLIPINVKNGLSKVSF